MKAVRMLIAALALLLVAGLVPVLSQSFEREEDNDVEEWLKIHEPGENHKMLTKFAGDWDIEVKLWFQPGQEPEVSKGQVRLESAMGGRFLHEAYEMKEGSIPHQGELWVGFDNVSEKYQSIMISSMDTGLRVFEGEYNEEKKELVLSAKYTLDMGGMAVETTQRNIYRFESDDKFTFTIMTHYKGFPEMPEEGVKEVEITYVRKMMK